MHVHDRLARRLLLLALFACCSCSGARTVTARHEDGRIASTGAHVRGLRDGPWTEYYANGNKQCEGSYADDVQSGLWTYWFENGHKEMEGRFTDERRDGEWRSWYENGALRAEGRFEAGFEEGPWRFHASSGALEHEGAFELGQPVLRWTTYHPDGTVRETGHYLAGARVGPWTAQDAAGHRTDTFYPLPADCELVEERFADGTLQRAGFLRDGVPAGRWHSYHPGGQLRLECSFRDGAPNGRARAWRADGSALARGGLKDGCIAGKWVFSRGQAEEEQECSVPRPRPTFRGEWSPAGSEDLPGWTAVETWIAEICSPRQPAPVPPVAAGPAPARAAPLAPDAAAGIPARAQPWTEYERGALPGLVRLYGAGRTRSAGDDDDWSPTTLLRSQPEPAAAALGRAASAGLVGRTLPVKRFTTADGGGLDLDEAVGKRNVLVTILRGFGGQVCVYCAAQTKALAEAADQFAALDTEVVVVFPGPASGLQAFQDAYHRTFGAGEKLPYKLLYDTDLALTRALHIEDNIAVPTSIVLDRNGIVRWCHVAKDHADRPSAQAILDRIAELPKRAR